MRERLGNMAEGAGGPVRRPPLASSGMAGPASIHQLYVGEQWIGFSLGITAMNGEIDHTGAEPAGGEANYTLADLVQDPLIRLVMKSDGVDRQSIERLFARIAGERPRAARQRAAAAAGRRLC